ncbi:MAG: hypothetical protein IPM64_17930 [Phycisphaerales bacterium]|nr:hypothetical protein [Phycisphaerales bacterium]
MARRPPPGPARPPLGLTKACRVVRVVDGDTLDVEVRYQLRVRLLDCWAPESRTKDLTEKDRGLASKEHLEQLAPAGSQAVLFVPGSADGSLGELLTLGRVLGHVWVGPDPHSLSERQRKAGHATPRKAA